MIRLSICIATLNRAQFIGETLESIVSQLTAEVEVVVVDGASTDNTEAIVRGFAARYSGLRYVRLDKKGGVDQDYCKAVELARGEYCWLFTDDDLLKPGAITAVLAALQHDYSLIIVNAEVRTADLGICLQERRVRLLQDRTYPPHSPDRNELLADAGDYLSFIGGVVMKRSVWNEREKAKYFGTVFIHMGVIFQSPLPGPALVLSQPWIIIRYGNAQWLARGFEIWMFKWPNLVWSFPDYADWAKQRVVPREPWRNLPRLLLNRAMGNYSPEQFRTWLEPRLSSAFTRALLGAIAKLPIGPLNWLARTSLRWILQKYPCITYSDLQGWRDRADAAKTHGS